MAYAAQLSQTHIIKLSLYFFSDVKHTLLVPPDDAEIVDYDSYTPDIPSYKFTGETVQVKPSDTTLVGLNLSAPFIVTAIFKSSSGKSACLFSITQNDRIVMSLCIKNAGKDISRVTLTTELYSPEDSISYLFSENFKEKWIKIVLYVREDTADLYVNCSKQPESLALLKGAANVVLTKDMKIQLAYPMPPRFKFEVSD